MADAPHEACRMIPRLIRATKAPAYLGMSRDLFDKEVRPHVRAAGMSRVMLRVMDRIVVWRVKDPGRQRLRGVLNPRTETTSSGNLSHQKATARMIWKTR
jgi:hypothetical protein